MKRNTLVLMIGMIVFLTSCGPYKQPKYKDIGTNETAFLIPMEQGNQEGQQMLKSVTYLEQKKVATKRVHIEQTSVSTGRLWFDYRWIPTDTVVIVLRSPVTRNWTKPAGDKITSSDLIMNVESKESIGFDVPVNCTGSVLEEDAATFLYHFGGQTIEYVMDHNVRAYILDVLSSEFGKRTLDDCQDKRTVVYDSMRVKTTRFFKNYGLTIVNIGAAGEFNYTEMSIQTAINTKFISEQKIVAADNEAAAAKKFEQAAESIRKQKELDADVQVKIALAHAIENGKLTWPNTLVVGDRGNLMDIWGAQNLSRTSNQ